METWTFMDAAMRASTAERHCVLPFMAYQRQDSRGENRRVPVTLRLVGKFLKESGATGVMTSEPHAKTNEAAFDIPVDVLFPRGEFVKRFLAEPELARALAEGRLEIVAPDAGAAQLGDAFSRALNTGLSIVTKRRTGPNESEAIAISGDVKGKTCIIVDDMIDTAGTVVHAAKMLKDHGAEAVYAAMVHPVLSGPAIQRINASVLRKIFVSDSIPLSADVLACDRIATPVSLAPMYAEAILAIVSGKSVSAVSRS
jgi:ribose-phosphate pyrophosphokinase